MFKRFLIIIFTIFSIVSIQIAIPSCENPFSSDGDTPEIMGDENEPTNNYYADVRIIKMGLFGCAQASISLDGEPVNDVEIQINKIVYERDSFGDLEDPDGNIKYSERTEYNLVVKREGETIAAGITYMPSLPKIMNLSDGEYHNTNTPLLVDWEFTRLASAIGIKLELGATTVTEPPLLPIFPSQYTIPGHFFDEPGSYTLSVIGYNGIAPGINVTELDSSIGYNIIGPAGVFVAINMDDPITIEVE